MSNDSPVDRLQDSGDSEVHQLTALCRGLDDQMNQLEQMSFDFLDDKYVMPIAKPQSTISPAVNGKRSDLSSGCGIVAAWFILLFLFGSLVTSLSSHQSAITQATDPAISSPEQDKLTASPPTQDPPEPDRPPQQEVSPQSSGSQSETWQACREDENIDAAPPQAGETWWPVVGPSESLSDSRAHCRADAFINKSGNVQIASFRDRSIATRFAAELSADNSHPHQFWVGDPSQR
jgi:hypothetical protein